MPRYTPVGCDGLRGIQKAFWILLFTVLALFLSSRLLQLRSEHRGRPGGGGGGKGGGRKGGGGGDVPVTVAQASQKNVPVEVQVIGNVEAYSTISVKAQVTGQLTGVNFHEGDYVKKGERFSRSTRVLSKPR